MSDVFLIYLDDTTQLITHPLEDRLRFHLGARTGIMDMYLNLDKADVRLHLQPKFEVAMRAYAAVGGKYNYDNCTFYMARN